VSWVAENGDVKSRSLYKIVSDAIDSGATPLNYSQRIAQDAVLFRQFRDAESDDADVQQLLKALRALKFNAAYKNPGCPIIGGFHFVQGRTTTSTVTPILAKGSAVPNRAY